MNVLLVRTVVVAVMVGWALASCPNNGPKFSALTFNTGLEPENVPYDPIRFDNSADALRAESANYDFMCLQEVWYERDLVDLSQVLKSELPYTFSALHHGVNDLEWGNGPAPCTKTDTLETDLCEAVNCAISRVEHWPENDVCMLRKCWEPIYALDKDCRTCGMISTPNMERCFEEQNRLNRPGIMVASRRPMHNVRYVKYYEGMDDDELVEKGFIAADVETENGGVISVACTDLSTDFDFFFDVKLKFQYATYGEMQRKEINAVHDYFGGWPHLFMGSFSVGPTVDGTSNKGEVETNYDYLTEYLGYRSDYPTTVGKCTYCMDNVMSHPFFFKHDAIVDHIFLSNELYERGVTCPTYVRAMDQDAGLSDHYGVGVTISLENDDSAEVEGRMWEESSSEGSSSEEE